MYREFLDFIFPLAEGAGKIQLAYFRGDDLAIRTKSNVYDVVTRADKESEAYIAAAILERWPDHEILGEEGGSMGRAATARRTIVRGFLFSRFRSPCNTGARRSPELSTRPT